MAAMVAWAPCAFGEASVQIAIPGCRRRPAPAAGAKEISLIAKRAIDLVLCAFLYLEFARSWKTAKYWMLKRRFARLAKIQWSPAA